MADISDSKAGWREMRRLWPMLAATCIGLLVAAVSWLAVSNWEQRLARAKFNDVAGDYAAVLQNGLDQYLGRIAAVRAFYDASVEVDPQEFALFTKRVLEGQTGKMRVIWAPRVGGLDRSAFEQKAQANGATDFAIADWDPGGSRTAAPPRSEYFPVLYSTGLAKSPLGVGIDLNAEPGKGEAIARARDSGTMATAHEIEIRGADGIGRAGFFVALPVYRLGMGHATLAERRANLAGIVGGAFQIGPMLDAILGKAGLPPDVDLYLYPVSAGRDVPPIYSRPTPSRDASGTSPTLADLDHSQLWLTKLHAGDASWILAMRPAESGFGTFHRAWAVLAGVLLVLAAVLAYMWASLRNALGLETANRRVLQLAQTDLLTNLGNRRAFIERLGEAFAESSKGAPRFAVLYLDIDEFKDVNDTLGHAMGDLLLKEVVTRLKHAVGDNAFVARFGGDEFAVLMFDLGAEAEAEIEALATKIGETLAEPFMVSGHKVRITSSIGIAIYAPAIAGPDAMMMQADLALYDAKAEGRNCYRFHSPDLDRQVHERVRVAEELRLAIEEGGLALHYQPQVELATGRIVGVEALIRWNHAEQGVLGPGHFIPIAERTGLMLPLGRFVFEEACRQMRAWQEQGVAPQAMSVNVSGIQFKAASELERDVEASLTRHGINPGDLELEITESVLMEATQRHSNTLENLRRLGVKIAIDDFGTGYSSLKYLTIYPVNRLKLAQEFVFRVTLDYRNAAVVRAAIRLARELGLDVIAEGVETEAQMRFLIGAGCEHAQGYYFSRPVTASRATELLRAARIEPETGEGRKVRPSAA